MKTELDAQFEKAIQGHKQGTEQYWAIKFKYDMLKMGKAREHNYKAAMVNSIIKMNSQIKKLQVSTFTGMHTEQLLQMGAAMTVLYDELNKNGLIKRMNNGDERSNNGNF